MQLTINGQAYTVDDGDPNRLLLYVIRDELGLTGTKFGCGAGICGSCTLLVDGQATRSCITPLSAVAGREIRTLEGLAETDAQGNVIALHPIQQAFIQHQVPQCSWCMNGQMMTALAFLAQNPHPTEEEVVEAMSRNYCRCGCYVRIKTAVLATAEMLATQDATGGAA